jgi:hypothetical protein
VLFRSRIRLGFGAQERSLSSVELNTGNPSVLHERLLALEVVGGLVQGCLSRGKFCLRSPQGIALGLRVQLGDRIARLDAPTDIHQSCDHPAIDAESEILFRAGPDVSGERDRLTLGILGSDNGPDGSDVRRKRWRPTRRRPDEIRAQPGERAAENQNASRNGGRNPASLLARYCLRQSRALA